jgi:hypothetical protein
MQYFLNSKKVQSSRGKNADDNDSRVMSFAQNKTNDREAF